MSSVPPEPGATWPEAASLVVLVAEDEMLLRILATDFLEEAGYTVLEARNAEEALAILNARTDVRALFSDIEMPPGASGLELAKAVREQRPEVGIVIASGKLRPRTAELPDRALFIPKPYTPERVTAALRAVLAR
jgi:DNA-binding NtrC family response regulator